MYWYVLYLVVFELRYQQHRNEICGHMNSGCRVKADVLILDVNKGKIILALERANLITFFSMRTVLGFLSMKLLATLETKTTEVSENNSFQLAYTVKSF